MRNPIYIAAMIILTLAVNPAAADPADPTQDTQNDFSPRDYCRHSGGELKETTNREIYVCCYREDNKCLASHTRLGRSIKLERMISATLDGAENTLRLSRHELAGFYTDDETHVRDENREP